MVLYLSELILKKSNFNIKIVGFSNYRYLYNIISNYIFSYKIINLVFKLKNYQTYYLSYFIYTNSFYIK